ncbi:serine/threonine-protein kinase [Ahniella affigens]|nr:serine/threonine-protein kinase [Ahniella affigens]
MIAEFNARSRALFDQALDLPTGERAAYVRAATAEHPDVRANVLELLEYHQRNENRHTQQPFTAMIDAVVSEQSNLYGQVVDRYELLEMIGQGGMGRVYKARRTDQIGQPLALKLIRKEFLAPNMLDRFAAEREILARLNHPNIAHFVDAGSIDGHTSFVAMELVDGLPLRTYLAQNNLDLKQRLHLFRQLLAAVAHAHRSLVVHRDIKPENVMVRTDGVLKLLDFGIAKLIGDQTSVTRTHERMFTPMNAAPEQILGQPCDVTTDVYALGALLYELIAGVPAFASQGRTPGELEHDILKVPPNAMRSRCTSPGLSATAIPIDLENIAQKALRKEPDGRYRNVEQLDNDILRLLADEPVSVSGNSMGYRLRKLVARHQLASALAAAILVTVLVAMAMVLAQNRRVIAERDRATLALDAMRQAFVAADPDGFTGGDIRARQILRQINAALLPLLAANDRQTAGLMLTLAEVQVSMGMLADAERSMQALNGRIEDNAYSCVLDARILVERDRLADAETALDQCQLDDEPARQRADLARARIAMKRSRFADAAARYEQLSSRINAQQPNWFYVQTQYADALASAGQAERALAHLDRAEIQARQFFPQDHPILARLKLARLEAMANAGNRTELLSQGPQIAATLQAAFGTDSIIVGRAESLVGQALLQDRQYAAAEPHLRNAWQTFRSVLGSGHFFVLSAELNLATALAGPSGNAPAAEPHFANVEAESREIENVSFHAFAAFSAAKYQIQQGKQHETLAGLQLLSANWPGRSTLDQDAQKQWRQWQAYGFWEADCAAAAGDYSEANLCRARVSSEPSCQAAQQVLCTPQSDKTDPGQEPH